MTAVTPLLRRKKKKKKKKKKEKECHIKIYTTQVLSKGGNSVIEPLLNIL